MKTLESTKSSTQLGKGRVGVGGDSKAARDRSKLDESEIDDDGVDSGEVKVDKIGKKVQKTSKSKNSSKSKKMIGSLNYLTLEAKLAFI